MLRGLKEGLARGDWRKSPTGRALNYHLLPRKFRGCRSKRILRAIGDTEACSEQGGGAEPRSMEPINVKGRHWRLRRKLVGRNCDRPLTVIVALGGGGVGGGGGGGGARFMRIEGTRSTTPRLGVPIGRAGPANATGATAPRTRNKSRG